MLLGDQQPKGPLTVTVVEKAVFRPQEKMQVPASPTLPPDNCQEPTFTGKCTVRSHQDLGRYVFRSEL